MNDMTVFQWAEWIVGGILFVILFFMVIVPPYDVWASKKKGQAALAEANFEQQVQIAKARARYEAAELNKKAAIVEAEAVAEQIKRIGDGVKEHPLYLRWQWIKMMEERDAGDTIYVPTEANLPVLEASSKALKRSSVKTESSGDA